MEISASTHKVIYFTIGLIMALISVFAGSPLFIALFLGAVFVLFTFKKFELSFGMALFAIPLVPHDNWNNIYFVLAMLFYFVVYVLKYVIAEKRSFSVKKFGLSFLVFIFASVLGVVFSYDKADSFRLFLFFAAAFFAAIIIIGTASDKKTLERYIMFIIFGMMFTAFYAVYQKIVGVEVDLTLVDTTMNSEMPGRIYSTFGNPNNYAEYLIMFLPFCFAFILNRKGVSKKILYSFIFSVSLFALILTLSRSSWVAFAIAAFVFLGFINFKFIPLIILVFILALPFMPSYIITRITTIGNMRDTSNAYRLYIWEGVFKMLKNYWATGVGLGPNAFHLIYPTYANPLANLAPHSHCLFLETWVEMGIIGFLSFICLFFGKIKAALKLILNKTGESCKYYLVASISALLGIAFIGCAEYIFFYPRVLLYFFVLIGIVSATINLSKKENF